MEVLNSLLGADFPKLCFIIGTAFFLLAIFGGGIVISTFKFPRIGKLPRIICGIMGALLILLPVASYFLNTTIGLYRVSSGEPQGDKRVERIGFVGTAEALTQPVVKLTITQRHKVILAVSEFASELTIYASDVNLKEPTNILLFRTGQEREKWRDSKKINISELLSAVRGEDIILNVQAKKGNEFRFEFKGKNYVLKVTKVLWFIMGNDYLEIEIYGT